MADVERAQLKITGHVQGVFYRANTAHQAKQLQLQGWVRNLSDGSVEAVAEGPRAAVEELIEWCRHGPPPARVSDVEVDWAPATGEFDEFRVEY